MATFNYGDVVNQKKTPQTRKVPNKKGQVKNHAGGISFKVSEWDQLDRFLILGSDSNTYYASAQQLTLKNAGNIQKLIKKDGLRVVSRIVEISDEGRAVKNDPALFALAMCAKLGDIDTRKAAFEALPKVARIGTHLFSFANYADAFGGWGRGLRNAVANWYNSKAPEKLEYQVVKYKQRNGWSHRDLLRLSHAKPASKQHNEIFKYVTSGESDLVFKSEAESALWTIWASEELKNCTTVKQVTKLINDYNLPREVVPTEWLNTPEVWEALIQKMPITATIRNLGKMSAVGLFKPLSSNLKLVTDRIGDLETLRNGRVHPLSILVALNTYNMGRGVKGSLTWQTNQKIVDALDGAFYKAFKAIEPANKRTLLAIDCSGSMDIELNGLAGISARSGAAVMSLVTAATEPNTHIVGFTSGSRYGYGRASGLTDLKISPKDKLTTAIRKVDRSDWGGTDCSLPMTWAKANKVNVDTFVIYTDNDTWAGKIHPFQALKNYRQSTGIPAKLVVVGMVANDFTIADSSDGGMLDVVGFSTDSPAVISNFSRG